MRTWFSVEWPSLTSMVWFTGGKLLLIKSFSTSKGKNVDVDDIAEDSSTEFMLFVLY